MVLGVSGAAEARCFGDCEEDGVETRTGTALDTSIGATFRCFRANQVVFTESSCGNMDLLADVQLAAGVTHHPHSLTVTVKATLEAGEECQLVLVGAPDGVEMIESLAYGGIITTGPGNDIESVGQSKTIFFSGEDPVVGFGHMTMAKLAAPATGGTNGGASTCGVLNSVTYNWSIIEEIN